MKEKIYTIPVNEVFSQECECPLCVLEKRLEEEYISYFLGPSLMEPDCRIETNDKGFCRRHFEQLYNKQENRLGLGLMIDTHITEQLSRLKSAYVSDKPSNIKTSKKAALEMPKLQKFKLFGGRKPAGTKQGSMDKLLQVLKSLENSCAICKKLSYTMERYIDVVFYLWSGEEEFREVFESKTGFCMLHFKQLIEASSKYLNHSDAKSFTDMLINMQMENLDRIQQEVSWFTRKFDYRNNEAPWGNSKDAVPRSIQKLKGFSDLK